MSCFWGHKWPKWSAPKQEQVVERLGYDSNWRNRTITIQDRVCEKCGEYEMRRVIIPVV